MKLYSVWTNRNVGVGEKCVVNEESNFVGVNTGKLYHCSQHYASPQYRAIIRSVDAKNETGMYHLDVEWQDAGKEDENRAVWKSKFIGCEVTVEAAHNCGELKVYRVVELNEYFSGNEIELIFD